VQQGIWHELIQLHAVHKKNPTKEFMCRKGEIVKVESERNITRNPAGGEGIASSLGKMISTVLIETLPSSLSLDPYHQRRRESSPEPICSSPSWQSLIDAQPS
jgi:hypothetical protein